MRPIDADALYETLCHIWDRSDSEEFEQAVFESIANAPTIDQPRGEWIPCSERLPEMVHDELIGDFCNSDPCIITYERHGCRWTAETTFVYCSDGLWRYCPNAEDEVYMPINDDCSIVAWMPLPEAMKEGEPNG